MLAFVASSALFGQEVLRWELEPGDEYRISGTNLQQILVDGVPGPEVQIATRVQVAVGDRTDDGGVSVAGTWWVTREPVSGSAGTAVESREEAAFVQYPTGRQTVPADRFVPTVRGVPSFPDAPVAIGDTWTAPAEEVLDLRDPFGVAEPVRVPMTARYRLAAADTLEIAYDLFWRPPARSPAASELRVITGTFRQTLRWDGETGRPRDYDEEYRLTLRLADGGTLAFVGRASGEMIDATPLDRAALRSEIEEEISRAEIADTTVRESEEGLTIAFENIRFFPDSAEWLPEEQEKLDLLATVLRRVEGRDVLFVGHTALAGTAEGRQRLSEERAAAVAGYVVSAGAIGSDRVFIEGRGAREPVADNATEAGMRRNRRVEVTILEN